MICIRTQYFLVSSRNVLGTLVHLWRERNRYKNIINILTTIYIKIHLYARSNFKIVTSRLNDLSYHVITRKIGFCILISNRFGWSIDLHLRLVRVQQLLRGVQFVTVSATLVTLQMRFAFETLRTERAIERRLLAAFPLHMAWQRVFSPIRSATAVARELAVRFADEVAGFRYLQLGKHHPLVHFPCLHGHVHGLVDHALVQNTWKWKKKKSFRPVPPFRVRLRAAQT